MAIVAVAILISFHLKNEASPLEKRIATPFGLTFWCLSIACLSAGLGNYIKTVTRYSRRQALVQTGWGTQLVSYRQVSVLELEQSAGSYMHRRLTMEQVFTVVASAIVAACVLFLSTNAGAGRSS